LGMSVAGAIAASRLAAKTRQFARARQQLIEASEEKLLQQHLRLDTALNTMTQGLNMFDATARLVLCNERYLEMYRLPADLVKPGCTVRDLVGYRMAAGTFFSIDPEQYITEVLTSMTRRIPTSATMELTDGRVISVISQPTASGGGWVVTHEDVTERYRLLRARRQAEDELRNQHIRLDAALNSMHQGLQMYDVEGRVVLTNQNYLKMYGLPPDAASRDWTIRDVLHLRKAAGTLAGDPEQCQAEMIDAGKVDTKVVELPDGRFISVTNAPVQGGGWVSTHNDITERRRAEKELDRPRSFPDTITENVPATIVVKDARDLRYVLINRHGEQFFGKPRGEMIGKTAYDFFRKDEADVMTSRERGPAHRATAVHREQSGPYAGQGHTPHHQQAACHPQRGRRAALPVGGHRGHDRAQARGRADRAPGAPRCADRPAQPRGVHRASCGDARQGGQGQGKLRRRLDRP